MIAVFWDWSMAPDGGKVRPPIASRANAGAHRCEVNSQHHCAPVNPLAAHSTNPGTHAIIRSKISRVTTTSIIDDVRRTQPTRRLRWNRLRWSRLRWK
jgi:hypothetical protein